MYLLEEIGVDRKFDKEVPGYPWYYVEVCFLGSIDVFRSGIGVKEKLEKPVYFGKYKFRNKTKLRKYKPVQFKGPSKKIKKYVVIFEEPGLIEIKTIDQSNFIFIYLIYYKDIDPELVKKVVLYETV